MTSFSSTASEEIEEKVSPPSQKTLILIGESHNQPAEMKLVYDLLKEKKESINFLIERDQERMDWANQEIKELPSKMLEADAPQNFVTERQALWNGQLFQDNSLKNIYSEWPKEERIGRLENRFWLLKILKVFPNQVIPIDESAEYMRSQLSSSSEKPDNNSTDFSEDDIRTFQMNTLLGTPDDEEKETDSNLMAYSYISAQRDLFITNNIKNALKNDILNIALVGLDHTKYITEDLQEPTCRIVKYRTPYEQKTKFSIDDNFLEITDENYDNILKELTELISRN